MEKPMARNGNLTTKRKSHLSKAKAEAFLSKLGEVMDVTATAKMIGLKSARALYAERKANPEFAERWKEIEDARLDQLEALQWQAALEHREDRRWVLSRRRQGQWSEKHTVGGRVEVEHTVNIKELSTEDLQRIASQAVEAEYSIE